MKLIIIKNKGISLLYENYIFYIFYIGTIKYYYTDTY